MSDNINVIHLAKYEPPIITESKQNDWVEFGADNNHYQWLIDRYTNSTTNSAIINNICRLIYGKGLTALKASNYPNEYAQMMSIFGKDDVKKIVTDSYHLGGAIAQVLYTKGKKKVAKVVHSPVNLWRSAKCDEEGEINGYWYSDDWTDIKKFPPKFYPAFGKGSASEELEIFFIRPYIVGMKYYSLPEYQPALSYALLEEEVSNYLISTVQNSFSGTKLVNFNNGKGTPEQQELIKNKVIGKLTGSTGDKVIIAFNDNKEGAATIEDISLTDAADQYQYLSEECMRKIMLGHNVTSPLLFGIATTTGFSANADELKNSAILMDNMVIRPKQQLLTDAFESILAYNDVRLELFFKTLQPLEFIDLENVTTEEQVQEKTGVEMSSHDTLAFDKLNAYASELGDDYELIDVRDVDYEKEDELDLQIEKANNPSLMSKALHFVSTGTAYPKRKSEQDGALFVSRYRYVGDTTEKSREFCKLMTKANKLYRKEDILSMSEQIVNEGWGAKGADKYSIWLYKGGGACHHKWVRETYRKKGTDLSSPLAKEVTPAQARKEGEILPTNDKRVYQRPIDMPNQGFLPK